MPLTLRLTFCVRWNMVAMSAIASRRKAEDAAVGGGASSPLSKATRFDTASSAFALSHHSERLYKPVLGLKKLDRSSAAVANARAALPLHGAGAASAEAGAEHSATSNIQIFMFSIQFATCWPLAEFSTYPYQVRYGTFILNLLWVPYW